MRLNEVTQTCSVQVLTREQGSLWWLPGSGDGLAELLEADVVVAPSIGVAVEVEPDRAVQGAVEHDRGDGGVTEDLTPFTDAPVGGMTIEVFISFAVRSRSADLLRVTSCR